MDYHIKMETRNGKTRWLETESTGERTVIFESFYLAEGKEQGLALSEELVGWVWGEIESEEEVMRIAAERNLKAIYEEMGATEYSELLWIHRDDKYGHVIDTEEGPTWGICKGSDLIELDAENLPMEDIYPYEPDSYYLSKDNIYVYKVGSVKDIQRVMDGDGDEFFEFC